MLRDRGRHYAFRDQAATLAAIERLERLCVEQGITREQALAALDRSRPRWAFMDGCNPLRMLGVAAPIPRVPDAKVRPVLLRSLPAADREALCVGMDASRYLRPAGAYAAEVAVGRLVHQSGIRPDGRATLRAPAYLEYDLVPRNTAAPLALVVPGDTPNHTIELWWADAGQRWSPSRSIVWRIGARGDDAVPLDRLPHWDVPRSRRLRVVLRKPGPIALGERRLVR
jgi:hypothetical protein